MQKVNRNAKSELAINYKDKDLKKTIRFIFIPETIGSIAYINENLSELKSKVIGGYNLSCIGDDRVHSMILTKYGNSTSDKSLLEVYKKFNIISLIKSCDGPP